MAAWEEVTEEQYHEHLHNMRELYDIGQTRFQIKGIFVHHIGHDYHEGPWVAKKEVIGRDVYYYIVSDPQ